jgi:tol-pal system protein YbgF
MPMTRFAVCSGIKWSAPLLAALTLSACASDYGPPINGQRALSPEEQRLQAVENKTVDLSRRLNAIESGQNNSQADEMRNLRGEVEQLRHDVDVLQQTVQQQYADTDGRLKRLEGGAQPPPAAGADSGAAPVGPGTGYAAPAAPVMPAAPPPPPAAAAPNSSSAEEEAIYLKSFDQLRAGKFDAAISGFHSMLSQFPQGNYADNAWFWMGQSYHVKGDDGSALKCYQSLLQQFPASPKVPEALVNSGVIYQSQHQNAQARDAFQKVLKQYPTSGAATQARTRLAQLQ